MSSEKPPAPAPPLDSDTWKKINVSGRLDWIFQHRRTREIVCYWRQSQTWYLHNDNKVGVDGDGDWAEIAPLVEPPPGHKRSGPSCHNVPPRTDHRHENRSRSRDKGNVPAPKEPPQEQSANIKDPVDGEAKPRSGSWSGPKPDRWQKGSAAPSTAAASSSTECIEVDAEPKAAAAPKQLATKARPDAKKPGKTGPCSQAGKDSKKDPPYAIDPKTGLKYCRTSPKAISSGRPRPPPGNSPNTEGENQPERKQPKQPSEPPPESLQQPKRNRHEERKEVAEKGQEKQGGGRWRRRSRRRTTKRKPTEWSQM